jgi:hypothetical protein
VGEGVIKEPFKDEVCQRGLIPPPHIHFLISWGEREWK